MELETYFLANGHYDVSVVTGDNSEAKPRCFIEMAHPLVGDASLLVTVDDDFVSSRRPGMSFAQSFTRSKPSEVKFPHVTDIKVKVFVLSKYDVLYQVSAVGLNVDMLPVGSINDIDDLFEVFDLWDKFNAVITLPVTLI